MYGRLETEGEEGRKTRRWTANLEAQLADGPWLNLSAMTVEAYPWLGGLPAHQAEEENTCERGQQGDTTRQDRWLGSLAGKRSRSDSETAGSC